MNVTLSPFARRAGIASLVAALAGGEPALAKSYSQKLFERLTGTPLLLTDPRYETMQKLVEERKPGEAARVATEDAAFYRITVREWAAALSNREESPLVPFDDFQALVIGVTRDGLDARELLSGNYRYEALGQHALPAVSEANNNHYAQFEARRLDYKSDLEKRSPQWDAIPDAAGLLTTRSWGQAHLVMGTNRRAIEYAFREFLCSPIQQWKDGLVPDHRVRRDIDRRPGGDPQAYQLMCRSCHAPMDALAGAFAAFDFVGQRLVYYGTFGVAPKMLQNGHVFPGGYVAADSSWTNLANKRHNETFGWRGRMDGIGVHELGAMMASAKGYSRCLSERVFRKICRRSPDAAEKQTVIEPAAERFEAGGYKLKALFEDTATQPACLGNPQG